MNYDSLIRERGCDTLTALEWCKAKEASVNFSPAHVTVFLLNGRGFSAQTLPAAVLMHVIADTPPSPLKP